MWRRGGAILALLGLGACVTNDPVVTTGSVSAPAGNWRIERQTDRITGTPLSSAILMTREVSNSSVAFPQPAMLQLTCFKRDAIVRFAFGFKAGSTRNSVLEYRFDDKPGRSADARFLGNGKTAVIDSGAAVAQFVQELSTSRSLYVRIRSLTGARSSAEFQVAGAPAAIAAGLADCPVERGRDKQRTAAR